MIGRAALAAFALLAVAPVASAADFSAGDWSVSCDDALYCIARTAMGDSAQLKIERGSKAGSSVFVTVRAPSDDGLAEGMTVVIDVLDRGFSETTDISRVYKGNEMTFAGDADRPLVEALRLGNRGQVTIRHGGSIGTIVHDMSLVGVTPVLAEMDRLQGRTDRADALVLRGGLSPDGSQQLTQSAAPAPAPLPEPAATQDEPLFGPSLYGNIVYAEADIPDAVLMSGYRVHDCDFPYVLEGYGAQVVGVTQGLELWMVPCEPADVNVTYYVAFHDATETEFYEFQPGPGMAESFALVTNPMWENETRQLTTTSYYGPNADCGAFNTYVYVSEDDAFDLIEQREKSDCDGVVTAPGSWPIAWSAN